MQDDPLSFMQNDPLASVQNDLRVYAAALDGTVYHYRDHTGLEADAIIELPDGDWAAFEIKLGSNPVIVDHAADALRRIAAKMARPPLALVVITGTGFALTRKDGVLQVPVGTLSP